MRLLSSAPCRRRPLSSNVRHRNKVCAMLHQNQRPSARAEQPRSGRAAGCRLLTRTSAAAGAPRKRRRSEQNEIAAAAHNPGSRCSQQESNHMEPQCHIERIHCVGRSGIQSVCGAAATTTAASGFGWLRPLECLTTRVQQRGAEGIWYAKQRMAFPGPAQRWRACCAALPNPSLKRSANGSAHRSSSAGPAAHFALAARRALPLSPA